MAATALVDQAREAFLAAERDPARAQEAASRILAQARATGDLAACSIAERALAAAALHVSDLEVAMRHARLAIRNAERAGAADLAAEARMTLAFAASSRGRLAAALREVDAAMPHLRGIESIRGQAQRGVILHQWGRLDEALQCYNAALATLRRIGDTLWIWRVLSNRGVLHGHRLELAAAQADLTEAVRLSDELNLGISAAYTIENLGWVHTMRGDLPKALTFLNEAEARLRTAGAQLGEVLRDRSELLLSMNLVADARTAAAAAVTELDRDQRLVVVPEVRLLLARAALLDGDPATALLQAQRAVREFSRSKRTEWVALAQFAAVSARRAGSGGRPVGTRELERVAEQLEATPWIAVAVDARIAAADAALERGSTGRAIRNLQLAGRSTRRGPAAQRARSWYATALLRHSTGNSRGAVRALRAGLRIIDEHRASFGATDIRARTAAHRTDLVRLGLRMAVAEDTAVGVFEWAERGRASLLHIRSVLPPDDPVLAASLSELRRVVSDVYEAGRAGRNPARALHRQAALEGRIRDHCRQQQGTARLTEPVPVGELEGALGAAALVEFVELDEHLHAVVVADRGVGLYRLGPTGEASQLLDRITYALHRLTLTRQGSAAGLAAARTVLLDAAGRLDRALFGRLPVRVDNGPLVVVPTGRLQSVPWSVLPRCAGRPVTVAFSATSWFQAHTQPYLPIGGTVAIAGPDLPGGHVEAERVSGIYGGELLTGQSATAAAAMDSLTRVDLAHLAVHGTLSQHNPLLSALRLSDGPLMIYDLERLPRTPGLVVLAACNSGSHVVLAGNELLGLSATFLARGTQQIIASVIPIPDVQTVPLMLAFHDRLVAGQSPAEALALTQQQVLGASDGPVLASAAGFVCIGSGLVRLPLPAPSTAASTSPPRTAP
ncbi:CHAT domain-containing tetratricopeptide repeat protein [Dactylosporangium sp. NPDC049525]|uniref:CHAT domain-containing protein n=1 Tax=Dactylosporangium sp. NPDC049525 TaxID=3154730 RepID=UPI0034336F71